MHLPDGSLEQRLGALLKATRTVASSLDLGRTLQAIIRQASQISGTNVVRLFLLDEATQVLHCRIGEGIPVEEQQDLAIPVGESFSGEVAATGKPLAVPDCRGDARLRSHKHVEEYHLISYLGLPVKAGDRMLGVLVFNTTAPRVYAEEEIAYLSVFADQAAVAIEHARLHGTAVRRAQHLATLNDLMQRLATVLDPEAVGHEILAAVQTLIPGAVGRLWEQQDDGALHLVANVGLRALEAGTKGVLSPGEGLSGIAVRTRGPVISADVTRDQRFINRTWAGGEGLVSCIALPLLRGSRSYGSLVIFTRVPYTFADEEIALLRAFADQAAVAIQNSRLHDTFVQRARHLETLNDLTRTLATVLDPQAVGREILAAVQVLIPGAVARLWEYTGETEELHLVASVGLRGPEGGTTRTFRRGMGLIGTALAERQSIVCEEIARDPRFLTKAWAAAEGLVSCVCLPLIQADRACGVLLIYTREPHAFTDDEVSLLRSLSAHAAIAIERARLFVATEQRAAELSALRDVGQAISSQLEFSAVLKAVVAGAIQLLGSQHAQILLWDEAGQTLEYGAASGPEAERVRDQTLELGRGVNGMVALSREPMILDDYQGSPYALPEFPEIVATITVPVLFGDRLLGVLHSHTTQPGKRFTPDEFRLFQMLATQAAIAIENARLHDAVRARAEQLATLTDLTRLLMGSLDVERVAQEVLRGAQILIPGAAGRLWDIGGPGGETLRVLASIGLRDSRGGTVQFRRGEGLAGIAASTRQAVTSRDITQDPRFVNKNWAAAEGLRSCILLPLVHGDKIQGILAIFTHAVREFSPGEVAILHSLAAHAALAIENARLHETVRRHADELEDRVRERTAELEEALRIKAEFLGKMSHELRTPLNFILGFTDLLLQGTGGPLTSKQGHFLDRIQTGGKRLLDLVTAILDLSRVDAGSSRLHLESVPLDPLVQEALARVQIVVDQKRLVVTTALDPVLPPVVADRGKLGQILAHLIGNAVKFTPDGGRITIAARQVAAVSEQSESAIGEYVEIAVEDSGIGIPSEALERIFLPFHQVDGSEIRSYGGAGVGLTLARQLVEQHGGRIWAESAGLGQGACFVVRLPRLTAPRAPHVLLVDDDPVVLDALGTTLKGVGYVIEQAESGADALAALSAQAPDLLILDIGLPDVDGWEVLRRVRGAEKTQNLRVLVLTGLASVHGDQALAVGADEFLAKPISARILMDTVARMLGRAAGEGVMR